MQAGPTIDDLVIVSTKWSTIVFHVCAAEDRVQWTFPTYDRAFRHAGRVAKAARVDVWKVIGGTTFERILRYRAPP